MRHVDFLWVGKLKRPFFAEAEAHYLGRIKGHFPVRAVAVKDGPAKADPTARNLAEGRNLLAKLADNAFTVCLDERGKSLKSKALADKLAFWLEAPGRAPCFVVGGPFGLSPEVKARADFTLSLGPMTLPHELARIVLLEQIYRAASILAGSPYHHE